MMTLTAVFCDNPQSQILYTALPDRHDSVVQASASIAHRRQKEPS